MKRHITNDINYETKRKDRPASTIEAREQQVAAKAVALAEKQIEEGTASSAVICHFLKLATRREQIEKEILEKQKELIAAKTEALQAQQSLNEMFQEAISAFREYNGTAYEEDSYDSDVYETDSDSYI